MSHAIQPLHVLRLIQGQGSQDLVNPQAGQYSATAMGPGQQIPQLVTFTPTQIIQQFYSGQLIPRPQIQQPFQGFGMYPGIQQFQDSRASLKVYPNSCRTLQPLDYNRINNLIYQLHQHQAQRAINLFNRVSRARILNNQTNNTINYLRLDHQHQYNSTGWRINPSKQTSLIEEQV
ncbi:MAG: hypothetical protein EZS28_044209 [Streblomastix strix]|uniref:Uncharacterized protein n=1 Tax=Streblomastix strix TaxID=222440 RepID=A0A5J4TSC2_9EUKA|nr:MAG: hypothetical protein EZS28_044209 [Streblomastix strix]